MQRLYASSVTCQQIKSTPEREGAAIVHYQSHNSSGLSLFDRFVSSANYCESAKRALPIAINTRDTTTCKIPVCREQKDDVFN